MIGSTALEGDGISDVFYELLWSKDALNFSPSINIPDTVVFKFGQPIYWYFTATNGRVKRKNRQSLINSKIEEAFNKQVLGYDVIASFISIPADKKLGDTSPSAAHPPRIEYLDRDGLNNLLYKRQKENHGILQKFVEPKSTHNESIRAIWSPKICLIERTQNINQLHDSRYGIYERCVTSEGPDYCVESAPLRGPVLAGQVQALCETIVAHVTEVTMNQQIISRMSITCKIDSRDKLWLLHSTSIRLYDSLTNSTTKSLINISSVISLPETIHLNPRRSFNKTIARQSVNCISCSSETLEDNRYPVSYKNIVNHYDYFLRLVNEDAAERGDYIMTWPPDKSMSTFIEICGNVGFGCLKLVASDDILLKSSRLNLATQQGNVDLCIPLMLRYLHPRLSANSYTGCKNDPLFLYKTTSVCESCYLSYAEFATLMLRNGKEIYKNRKPDPASLPNTSSNLRQSTRPSSADWKAISLANKATSSRYASEEMKEKHKRAMENSIGLRSADVKSLPTIPPAISSPVGVKGIVNNLFKSTEAGITGPSSGVDMRASSIYSEKHVHVGIAERERNFFESISKNPQLRDHHPLMHMIAAQRKIDDANISISVSEAIKKEEGPFGKIYGHQIGDKYEKYSSYKLEIPYNINGMTIKPSKLRRIRRDKKKAPINSTNKTPSVAQLDSSSNGSIKQQVDNSVSSSSRHSEFLESTLASITNVNND